IGSAQARRETHVSRHVQLSGAGVLQEARLQAVRLAEGLPEGTHPDLVQEGVVMASNIKTKPSAKESPTEPFKRAVTGCLRALARKPELEVAFAAERPGLMGGKVRLPEPPRKLGKGETGIGSGHAAPHL